MISDYLFLKTANCAATKDQWWPQQATDNNLLASV
jgi:hypothetical protein